MNVSGSSFETALPPAPISQQAVVLDRLLGPNTYRIRSRVMVQRRGNWYEALTLDLYSGTPVVMYFHWLFPPGSGLSHLLAPTGLPPVRTAFAAFGEADVSVDLNHAVAPGHLALLLAGNLNVDLNHKVAPGTVALLIGTLLAAGLAAGYVMRKGRR